jgi:hypothetical protein
VVNQEEEGETTTTSISTKRHYILNWRNFNNNILLLFNKLDLGELPHTPNKPRGRCTVDSPDLMVNINKLDIMVVLTRVFNLPTPRLRLVIPKMMIRP